MNAQCRVLHDLWFGAAGISLFFFLGVGCRLLLLDEAAQRRRERVGPSPPFP